MDDEVRDAVITDLFRALEDLMGRYPASRAADADRITGELARHLALARDRLRTLPRTAAPPTGSPAAGPAPATAPVNAAATAGVERVGLRATRHRAGRRLHVVPDPAAPAPRP